MHSNQQLNKTERDYQILLSEILDNFEKVGELEATVMLGWLAGVKSRISKSSDKSALSSLYTHSIRCGRLPIIKYLIEEKIPPPPDKKKVLQSIFAPLDDISVMAQAEKNCDVICEIYKYVTEEMNISFNQKDINGILFKSAGSGDIDSMIALMKLNLIEDINLKDEKGHTAIYYATINKQSTMVEMLEGMHARLNVDDRVGLEQEKINEAILKAIKDNNVDKFKQLLEERKALGNVNFISEEFLNLIKSTEMAHILLDTMENDLPKGQEKEGSLVEQFSHRLGVTGDINIYSDATGETKKYETEGASHVLGLEILNEAASEYAKTNPSFISIQETIDFTRKANLFNYSIALDLLLERYEKGKPVLLTGGWEGHTVGISIRYDDATNKTYIDFSNRGQYGLKACLNDTAAKMDDMKAVSTGTIIYELNGKLDSSFINKFGILQGTHNPRTKSEYQPATFTQDDIKTFLKDAVPIAVLPGRAQKHGTCSYVNPKKSIEGMLFVDKIIKQNKLNSQTTEPSTNPNQLKQLAEFAYDEYKKFSSFDKDDCCLKLKNYYKEIKQSENASDDLEVLNELISKIIIEHHHSKDDNQEIHRAKHLFALLPSHVQKTLKPLLPPNIYEAIDPPKLSGYQSSFMWKQKPIDQHITMVFESVRTLAKKNEGLANLINVLESETVGRNAISKIVIEDNNVRIFTKANENIKSKLIERIQSSGGEIVNVSGKFQFIVKNVDSFKIEPIKSDETVRNEIKNR